MKTAIIFILCVICSINVLGQNQKLLEETTCTTPKFTGVKNTIPVSGEEKIPAIVNYLRGNVNYPEDAQKEFQQGTEVVKFFVGVSGDVSNIEIVNSVSEAIDEEVTSVLKSTSGMWKPGNNNGIPVSMGKEVSVIFRLEDSKYSFNDLGKKYYSHGAEMLFTKQSPKKALRYFNKGIVLFPNERPLLALRGLALFEIGDRNGARRDWNRVKNLGGFEGAGFSESLFDLKGYSEMIHGLEK